MIRAFGQRLRVVALAGLVATLAVGGADARAGGGASVGSRGGSTFSRPPSTATAPGSAQPMQRTETPSMGSQPGYAQAGVPARRGFGFGGGFLTGLVGAGLLGAMFGGGFFGGLGSIASLLGLLIQVGLAVGLVWLVMRVIRRRSEPALAGAAGGVAYGRSVMPGAMAGGGSRPAPAREPVQVGPSDFSAFERMLGEIQVSYGRGDLTALRRTTTPEMARYFEQDLAADRAQGRRNEVSAPKLLQGDLAEAWREGPTEYATVAMRFEVIDVQMDVGSGRVLSGHPSIPTEATELWTFRRDGGSAWVLSAIQQTA